VRLNVLVIDRAPPVSASQGNELIARSVFPLLRDGHRLTLVAPVVAGQEAAARTAIDGLFDTVHLVPRARRLPSLAGWLEATLSRLGIPLGGRLDTRAARRLSAEVRRILATEAIDVVHVRQLPMAAYAGDLGQTPRLLELIDAETLASARDRAGTVRSAIRGRVARAIERRSVRPFPVVTVVADPDAVALRRLVPGTRVEVVPNGVDAGRFRPQPELTTTPGSIAFVGAMSFPPNVEAMRWFVADVLPALRAARPDVTVTIVGRDPDPTVLALADDPAVTVTGAVDDVRPFLARAAVVVAPMVSGSGIKNKILEAMAMQRPVVATSLAAEGLAATPGRDIVVADGAAAFATAVAALLGDPARAASIAAAGRALVERRYTWEACAAAYAALYAELAGTPDRSEAAR
jgi:glycosyltransferase involved in cell wall biosynthesis